MDKSGGMLVHKSIHYLDLINFFVASVPRTVYARGERNMFNETTASALGITDRGTRCEGAPPRTAARMRGWLDQQKRAFAKRKAKGKLTREDTFNPQR